jgi:hypothetical protein
VRKERRWLRGLGIKSDQIFLNAARIARTESNPSWSPTLFLNRTDKWTEAKIVKMAETAQKDQTVKRTLEKK